MASSSSSSSSKFQYHLPASFPSPEHNLPQHFENLFANGNFLEDENDANNRANRLNGNNEPNCWVFGYGSLCWHPGFEYNKCITGYIRGYNRRFWQGNTTHRGTVDKVSLSYMYLYRLFTYICSPHLPICVGGSRWTTANRQLENINMYQISYTCVQ